MLFEVDVCITIIVIDIVFAFTMCFFMGSTHTHSFILNGNIEVHREKYIYVAEHISIFILQTKKSIDADKLKI